MINRRNFLKVAGLAGMLPLAGRTEEMDLFIDFSPDEIRVFQGLTNSDSTLISVLAHRDAQLQIEVLNYKDVRMGFSQTLIDMKLGDFVIYQLYIPNLQLEKTYSLAIYNKGISRLFKRHFKALDWSRTDAKIAFLTCANHRDAKPKTNMFSQLFKANPDVIFFPGDLVYANSVMDTVMDRPAPPDKAYMIFTKTLMDFDLYERMELVPVFATWDDHDLAFNNAEYNHPTKDIMLKMFRAFFPADERILGTSQGPGLAFAIEAFGMQVVFLDGRYYKHSKAQQFLGAEQMKWLESEIKKSSMPLMLISPQQFWIYRSMAESYQRDGAREFAAFLDLVKRAARPTIFVSGDVHYSQIQEISADKVGFKTFEITSSAFFSSSARSFGKRSQSAGQLEYYGYPNFLVFENRETTNRNWKANVTCVSESSQKHFFRELSVEV